MQGIMRFLNNKTLSISNKRQSLGHIPSTATLVGAFIFLRGWTGVLAISGYFDSLRFLSLR